MNVRPFRIEDWPVLKEIHERGNHGDAFPDDLADYWVVEDAAGFPLMAAGARMVPEIGLICAPGGSTHALVKLKGLSLLHEKLRDTLREKGFHEAIIDIAPHLAAYGRHLQRHFGWKSFGTTYRLLDTKGEK